MDITDVRRHTSKLLTEVRNLDGYVSPAGWLGANPRNQFHIENAKKRVEKIKSLLASLEEAMNK